MTDAGIIWFPVLGFRPAVWTPPHRADSVDPARLVPAPDADMPLLAKFDPLDVVPGYAWGTWLPAAPPVCCIETGPYTPLPSVETVPVPATAGLLLAAVVVLAAMRRRG